jgi:nitrogenase subunit NifH
MKSFRDYLAETAYAAENPVAGDTFAINIREEQLVETYVVAEDADSVTLFADDHMMAILENYGLLGEKMIDIDGTEMNQYDFDTEEEVGEAEYHGREVPLNKPMAGDVKKSKVYVKNPKGNVVKVNFGDPNMRIKKSSPAHRKSFRARHHCENPGPKTSARYWSCRAW